MCWSSFELIFSPSSTLGYKLTASPTIHPTVYEQLHTGFYKCLNATIYFSLQSNEVLQSDQRPLVESNNNDLFWLGVMTSLFDRKYDDNISNTTSTIYSTSKDLLFWLKTKKYGFCAKRHIQSSSIIKGFRWWCQKISWVALNKNRTATLNLCIDIGVRSSKNRREGIVYFLFNYKKLKQFIRNFLCSSLFFLGFHFTESNKYYINAAGHMPRHHVIMIYCEPTWTYLWTPAYKCHWMIGDVVDTQCSNHYFIHSKIIVYTWLACMLDKNLKSIELWGFWRSIDLQKGY